MDETANRANAFAEDLLVRVLGADHSDSEALRTTFVAGCDKLLRQLERDGEDSRLIGLVRERCRHLVDSIPRRHKVDRVGQ